MATKITPISKSKTIDYSQKKAQNFWKQKTNNIENQENRAEIEKILFSIKEGIVCLQTPTLTDKNLVKQIFDIAKNHGVRFYILVNVYSQELDMLNEICLIRYEIQNKGSFMLINPNANNSKGVFFTGSLTEEHLAISEHISKVLEAKETEELYRHFCYQFWETAKKEIVKKGEKKDITTKPLDIFHDIHAFGGKDFVFGTLFDFVETANRSDVSGESIIYLNQENQTPTPIKPQSVYHIGQNSSTNLLAQFDFEHSEPSLSDDDISVMIEYQWENIPFYLPEQAKEHALYEQWKKKTAEIIQLLDGILKKIEAAEKKEAGLAKAIFRFFLGKKTVFSGLSTEIETFKQLDFSNLTEIKLKEKIKRVNEIHAKVQAEINEIETEDKKAKIDEEVEKLKANIAESENKLTQTKLELVEKEAEAEKKITNFLEKHDISKADLGKKRSEWQQKSGSKNKKDNPEEAQEAEKKLSELNEAQNQTFIQKSKDEVGKLEKEIKTLTNSIESKNKEKSKLELVVSKESALDVFDSSSKSEIKMYLALPNLSQLPQIGKLYESGNQAYLTIEYWEEYEDGLKEAERLHAKLCTTKN